MDLNSLHASGNIFHLLITFANSLDPDQAWHVVGPDLGPSCLQRLSADDKNCHLQGKELKAWGQFNDSSALGGSLYWCKALHMTNKDR